MDPRRCVSCRYSRGARPGACWAGDLTGGEARSDAVRFAIELSSGRQRGGEEGRGVVVEERTRAKAQETETLKGKKEGTTILWINST